MRKFILPLLLVLTSFACSISLSNAAGFTEGKEYKLVDQPATPAGDKVEVLEFFWYGCPHCFSFEPYIKRWLDKKPANVEFVRIPAVFRPDWKVQARTYYALEQLGSLEKLHGKIFEEIHKNRKHLNTLDEMTSFLVSQGVDKQAFTDAYNSFAVDGSLRKSVKKQSAYNITGVPTVIINGKYMTSGSMAGTYDKLLEVMDYLVAQESAK
jgi:thiol:disulfide interchange protein DsbA